MTVTRGEARRGSCWGRAGLPWLLLAACGGSGGSPPPEGQQAEARDAKDAERVEARGSEAPLAHGQPSLEALGKAVVAALAASDGKALWALSVTETELEGRLFHAVVTEPRLVGAGPKRAWLEHSASSRSGLSKALGEHGGKGYAFVSLVSTTSEARGGVVIHRAPTLTVADASGSTRSLPVLGTVLEHPASGTWVVLAFAG